MEDAIRLYRTLLGNRAYLRSLCEGAAFLAASAIAIFAVGHLCYGPRQQLRHRFCAEPRRPLQRALPVHLRDLCSVRHYGQPAGLATQQVAIRAQGHRAVPAGPRRVRGAHPHGAIADRSAEGGAVLQLDFLRQRSILLRPHGPAVSRRACLLAHPAMANVLSRADCLLRLGRAARPLSLFDRRACRTVHHPRRLSNFVLAIWPGLRAISLLREPDDATTKAGKPKDIGSQPVAEPDARPNRSCCTSSETKRCRAANPKPN